MRFKERCYEIVKQVPRGRVISYKQVASRLGSRAYRAVGGAMKANRDSKVPCHRVVRSDGYVGGFARGTEEKIKLLEKEGVIVINNRIDLKRFGV
jgi:methylated-DNA-[protein]-cysteine S-methyltransferase